MPKLRFLGNETHNVPVLDRAVEPDELVTVAADVFSAYEWPAALWAVEASHNDKAKG